MKKLFPFLLSLTMSLQLVAQPPQKMSYQSVIRNTGNILVANTAVGIRISILQGSPSGVAVFVETHSTTTNANGLATLIIGNGTPVSGTFGAIEWPNGPYFIKTETDPQGGTNYTITGTSQLLSAPYALMAANGLNKGTAAGQMAYWDGSNWVIVASGNQNQILSFTGGKPTWTPSQLAPTDVFNPTTGKIWMNKNLGAAQVATSSTDMNAYGDLYQWGRGTDGHQSRTSPTTTTLSNTDQPGHGNFILNTNPPYDWRSPQNTNLWQGVNGTNNPCPTGYRLPTKTELNDERASWSSNNAAGAFASQLKLTMGGARSNSNGPLSDVGSFGRYRTSTVSGTDAIYLSFNSSNAFIDSGSRAYGISLRCIKDEDGLGDDCCEAPGTANGQMKYWNGTDWVYVTPGTTGQTLTYCNGVPTWGPCLANITSLNCNSATNTGTLPSGVAASGVTSSIPYTGGNGGIQNGQTVSSTGVTGLTATLLAGSIASGSGNLAYTISGTPSTNGMASFAISIGGQSCTLKRYVGPEYAAGSVFCESGPTIVVDVLNPATGKTWMDRNLGASYAAIANNGDSLVWGDLYQWGRATDGHQCRSLTTTTTVLSSTDQPGHGDFISNNVAPLDWRSPQNGLLWQGVNGVNNPCPSGYRLPTHPELNAERLTWGAGLNNRDGAINSPLKLPAGGFRPWDNFNITAVQYYASYWTSTVTGTNSHHLYAHSTNSFLIGLVRVGAVSVRCIKN